MTLSLILWLPGLTRRIEVIKVDYHPLFLMGLTFSCRPIMKPVGRTMGWQVLPSIFCQNQRQWRDNQRIVNHSIKLSDITAPLIFHPFIIKSHIEHQCQSNAWFSNESSFLLRTNIFDCMTVCIVELKWLLMGFSGWLSLHSYFNKKFKIVRVLTIYFYIYWQ